MALEFTDLDGATSLGVVECSIGDVTVASPTRFCNAEAKVESANPAAGTVDVAPPVALIKNVVRILISGLMRLEYSLSTYLVVDNRRHLVASAGI